MKEATVVGVDGASCRRSWAGLGGRGRGVRGLGGGEEETTSPGGLQAGQEQGAQCQRSEQPIKHSRESDRRGKEPSPRTSAHASSFSLNSSHHGIDRQSGEPRLQLGKSRETQIQTLQQSWLLQNPEAAGSEVPPLPRCQGPGEVETDRVSSGSFSEIRSTTGQKMPLQPS